MFFRTVLLLCAFSGLSKAQWDPHFVGDRTSFVHLFEWRWNDIAEECERFLGPYGYGGVQVSPPNENRLVNEGGIVRPWYERYQPVSYKLETRSGTEEEFKSMVQRCNNAGVRIYVDAVINHMTGGGGSGTGTGGSYYDHNAMQYDGVPYSNSDFNGPHNCPTASGGIEDYNDANQVRNCKLVGLNDLSQSKDYVRDKIVEFLNRLIGYGVAGFRVDASKHMWPGDMEVIFSRLNNLPSGHGFPAGAKPFVVQEVIDLGGEAISADEYLGIGRVTEFRYSRDLGSVFKKFDGQKLSYLKNFGEGWAMMADGSALAFVDNHDNQRGHGAGGASIITFKESRLYKMATAFMQAWPYGVTRIMSSFAWDLDWTGPPHDSNYNTLPVTINPDNTCSGGWICEHRWSQIYGMSKFRNVVSGTAMNDWWDNGSNQIAFCRGGKGFIAINNDDYELNETFQTCLPAGSYCDVITGYVENRACTGKVIEVGSNGMASIRISNTDADPVVAIHVESKL